MKLSEHFTLAELTITQVQADNRPIGQDLENLRRTALRMELVRKVLGDNPIVVTSAYRSPEVNKAVGGAPTSAHLRGWAVDFRCPKFGTPLQVARAIEASLVEFDQLIHEYESWVHISFDPRMRGQMLTISKAGKRPGLV